MQLFSSDKQYKLYQGNMLDLLSVIEPNSIDSVITDPPYELNFMNKGWDNSGIAFQRESWEKCYAVLKPGGYLLAFGGSRTFHRIACAIEDAGFEIRDTIMWLYGSGFPKSLNIGLAIDKKNGIDNRTGNIVKGVASNNTNSMKNGLTESQEFASEYEERKAQNEWQGWGTTLKPSYEPIIVARKPCDGSTTDNVLKWGVGGINIDECRVEDVKTISRQSKSGEVFNADTSGYDNTENHMASADPNGRFPSNTILTYDDADEQEVCENMILNDLDSNGLASRYFYCAKASKRDRDDGLDLFEEHTAGDLQGGRQEGSAGSLRIREDGSIGVNPYAGNGSPKRNVHPTVKPTSLMQYLVRLVTPKGGTVLDPFNGSGSTGKAVMWENRDRNKEYTYIGIEMTEQYLPISKARIEYAQTTHYIPVNNEPKINLEKLSKLF